MYFEEPKQSKCEKWNPKNRFLLVFCNTYEVDKGWGCGCCGCRAFPFSLGVFIFSFVMLSNCIKDFCEIQYSNYLVKSKTKDKTFVRFFYFKLIADLLCIIGGLEGVVSVLAFSYCLSVLAYYTVSISFILNCCFIIYTLTVITTFKFWWNVGFLKIFAVIMWYVYGYVWLLFSWILFCNMVDINRKKQSQAQQNQYNFGF